MHFYNLLCRFLISHIILIITVIYKTIKIYISDIYNEMSDIQQYIKCLRVRLYKSKTLSNLAIGMGSATNFHRYGNIFYKPLMFISLFTYSMLNVQS